MDDTTAQLIVDFFNKLKVIDESIFTGATSDAFGVMLKEMREDGEGRDSEELTNGLNAVHDLCDWWDKYTEEPYFFLAENGD